MTSADTERSSDSIADAPNAGLVAVVGSAMMDLITYTERIPDEGQTLSGTSFELGFGGKGANQAVMARLLGAPVAFVGRVGDDSFADMTITNFNRLGINISGVSRSSGTSTGAAAIWVTPDGSNRIICVGGANDRLTDTEASESILSLPEVAVTVSQFEIQDAAILGAFRAAKVRGSATILNPAPSRHVTAEILQLTDWLVVNENEFEDLTDTRQRPRDWKADDQFIIRVSQALGIKLVITLGSDGALLSKPDGTVFRVPAPAVKTIDTTGAGDAFVGGLAFGVATGRSELQCVELGCYCGSRSVTQRGTQRSYPRRHEIARFLRASSPPTAG